MSLTTITVPPTLIRPAIAIGCIVIGCAFVDYSGVIWPILIGSLVLAAIAGVDYLRKKRAAVSREEVTVSPAKPQSIIPNESELLVQDLFCPYTQCVVEAAQRLGELRDTAAVDSLLTALDRSALRAEPGWQAVSNAIVDAIAKIGDARALPALDRVRFARGFVFQETVDAAIAALSNAPRSELRVDYSKPVQNDRRGVLLTGELKELP